MKIKSIELTNVKGIGKHNFKLDLIPNHPNILVAPNGFGKSSFAIAFDSLRRNKIELDKKNYYNDDDKNRPVVSMLIEDFLGQKMFVANDSQNTINDEFNVFVINSQLFAKGTKLNIQGNVIVKSSLEITPTILISTIPHKVEFNYKVTDLKSRFGTNGKILPNITNVLACAPLLCKIENLVDFKKFSRKKNSQILDSIKAEINLRNKNATDIKNWIETEKIAQLSTVPEFIKLSQILRNFNEIQSDADSYLAAFQLIDIEQTMGADFKKAINYICYLDDKAYYEKNILNYNTTRYKIIPKVDKKHNKLIVEWPKAHEISNGQRDILSFITLLMKAERSFRKQNCILVIDEIFDYLDDANLITFQYFITHMIEEMKKDSKNFFPILMTHLDPFYFNQFCFNKHKIKVVYLKDMPYHSNPNIAKLIRNREDPTIQTNVDTYFFHYHPDSIDISADFKNLKLPGNWGVSTRFHQIIIAEVQKYLNGQINYDPLAICFGVRVRIEELLYAMIPEQDKKDKFIIEEHGTKKKLDYCETLGLNVPESYYLLGIIYNDKLHFKGNVDIARPVAIKQVSNPQSPTISYRHPLSAIPLGLQITWLGLVPSVCPSGQTDNIELM